MVLNIVYRKGTNKRTLGLFHEAAKILDVEIVEIVSNSFDFSDYKQIENSDALICISDDRTSSLVEKCLVGEETTTFYKNYIQAVMKIDDVDDVSAYLIHKENGLPTIDSIVAITSDKPLLLKYVNRLGGFPIVIKALGGQKGHGTMIVNSPESLNSIDDFLINLNERFILKKFIHEHTSVRAIVIGDKVTASIEHQPIKGDFRSNSGVGNHHTKTHNLNEEQKNIAVRAVSTLGYETGGVDLSIDEMGNTFITEVNFPYSFVRSQEITQINIAKEIIFYLLQKTKRADKK